MVAINNKRERELEYRIVTKQWVDINDTSTIGDIMQKLQEMGEAEITSVKVVTKK